MQQLEQKQVDSWERIHEAFPVKSPNDEASWDASDDRTIAEFVSACPLLGKHKMHPTCIASLLLFAKILLGGYCLSCGFSIACRLSFSHPK